MKLVGFFVTLLAAQIALASPVIGDKSKLVGTITVGGDSAPITSLREIIDYDATAKKYKIATTRTIAGQAQSDEEMVEEAKLSSKAVLQDLVKNCKARGGQTSQLIVAAGTFDTCMIGRETEDAMILYMVGDVPFGIVAMKTMRADGSMLELELESFQEGKK